MWQEVTGANRGIGRSIVEALVARGAAKVYAAARNPDGVADLVAAHGERVVALKLDVTDAAQVAAAALVATDVDLLVNNAGIATGLGLSIAHPAVMEGALAEMEVNYFGLLRVTQAFAPALAANGGGSLVNLSSVVGLTAFAPFVSYSASKLRCARSSSRRGSTSLGRAPKSSGFILDRSTPTWRRICRSKDKPNACRQRNPRRHRVGFGGCLPGSVLARLRRQVRSEPRKPRATRDRDGDRRLTRP